MARSAMPGCVKVTFMPKERFASSGTSRANNVKRDVGSSG
jgi:hypothetical protein